MINFQLLLTQSGDKIMQNNILLNCKNIILARVDFCVPFYCARFRYQFTRVLDLLCAKNEYI